MKLVVQRVSRAEVSVEEAIVGHIGQGLLVLLGVHHLDTPEVTSRYVDKLVNLRIFEDDAGKMNKSVKEVGGEILIVSQFTLYGNSSKGRRPSFIQAAGPDIAIPIYEKFVEEAKTAVGRIQTGVFGALMEVSLVNQGPVTIILENLQSYTDHS